MAFLCPSSNYIGTNHRYIFLSMVFLYSKGGNFLREFKRLIHFTKGYRFMYLLGIISIIISHVITIINPLVIRTTIDSIIGDNPIDSSIVLKATNMLGGLDNLRSNLWIIGLIIIGIALLRGVFLYFKNTLSSKSAESIVENLKNQL